MKKDHSFFSLHSSSTKIKVIYNKDSLKTKKEWTNKNDLKKNLKYIKYMFNGK